MKLHQKLPAAKKAVEFIARHDDASVVERRAILDELRKHIDAELKAADEREKKAAGKGE